ncbi:MAG TPA: alpha/beta fold hydrolase [Candidatus Dormibacteraeota bacterium]
MAGLAERLIVDLRREVDRSVLRGRNGIRVLAGSGRTLVGRTPKDTVWSRDKVELWRYRRTEAPAPGVPLLLVMSLVTRTYIFDLLPGNSIVEKLLAAGFDVFLVDWGVPDELEAHNTLETYVEGYLPEALEAVRAESGAAGVNVLGYCLGGLLALLAVAQDPRLPVRNLALMATPVSFAGMGLPVSLIRTGRLDLDQLVDHTGNVPPGVLLNAFRTRNPTGELVQYANLLENLWNDRYVRGYQALNMWIHDHIPFPGAAARQVTEQLVREDRLVEGRLRLSDRRVSLKRVKTPLLVVMAETDDVVPPATAAPAADLVGSRDVEVLRVPAGHVALVTGRTADRVTIPGIVDWLRRHPE